MSKMRLSVDMHVIMVLLHVFMCMYVYVCVCECLLHYFINKQSNLSL